MTIESDFRSLLAGNAGVAALVGTRVAQSAVPSGDGYPLVVFTSTHDYTRGLDNSLLGDTCSLNVQCWAETAVAAGAVADAVADAVATVPDYAVVDSRSPVFDEALELDGVVLIVTWMA